MPLKAPCPGRRAVDLNAVGLAPASGGHAEAPDGERCPVRERDRGRVRDVRHEIPGLRPRPRGLVEELGRRDRRRERVAAEDERELVAARGDARAFYVLWREGRLSPLRPPTS